MPERRRKVEGGEVPSSEDDEEEEEDSRASMWRGGKTVGLARQAIRQGADMAVTGHSAMLQTGGQLHCGSHCGTVRGRRAGADCGEDTHPAAAQTFTWHR